MNNWNLVNLPDDTGVKHVGGRLGAKDGPDAFWVKFQKLKGKKDLLSNLQNDRTLSPTEEIYYNHKLATHLIREAHSESPVSIVVGGGHDYVYSQLKGIKQAFPDQIIGCINIDPHFDMRQPNPEFSSGSPFYVALEEGIIAGKNIVEFGIQEHCNAAPLWEFAKKHQVEIVLFNDLRFGKSNSIFEKKLQYLCNTCDRIVVSLDMDVFQAAFAPGVSAPATEGFTPSEGLFMMELAGQIEKVISLGIYELNPTHDIDDRTARLAATCAYHFLQQKID